MRVWALVLVAGCGRVNFDEHDGGPRNDGAGLTCPTGFTSVATGRSHSCAIDGAGQVWCWGKNVIGQVLLGAPPVVTVPVVVPLPSPAAQVVAGREHSCARLDDGTVWCWGSNLADQLGAGVVATNGAPVEVALGSDRAIDLAAGAWHTCIRRSSDSAVLCWGDNRYFTLGTLTPMQSPTPVLIAGTAGAQALTAGHRHSCIVDAASRVECWGRNQSDQLGTTGADRATLAIVTGVATVTDVSAAGGFSCSIEPGGIARCWGRADASQLGPGVTAMTPDPGPSILSDAIAVEPSGFGACAIRADRSVTCWGKIAGADGKFSYTAGPRPSSLTHIDQVSGPFFHLCGVGDGRVACWGANVDAELGRGTRAFETSPRAVAIPAADHIAISWYHACASSGSSLYCWGENTEGQMGDPMLENLYAPVQANPGLTGPIEGVTVNRFHSCAWAGGTLRCAGLNGSGQLGNNSTLDALWVTTQLTNVTSAAAGLNHTCAIASSQVYCWGIDSSGELGNGATGATLVPGLINTTVTNPTYIASGKAHSCMIDAGTVKCWGYNGYGNLGDGSTTNRQSPVTVTLPAAASQLSLGDANTCALLVNGDVYCWGFNADGDLGTGLTSIAEHLPVRVALPSAAAEIAFSIDGGCARLTSGSTYCWGLGTRGELGDGIEHDVLLPIAVGSLASSLQLARSFTGGCAIASDKSVSCWGAHLLLADGDTSENVPTSPAFPGCL